MDRLRERPESSPERRTTDAAMEQSAPRLKSKAVSEQGGTSAAPERRNKDAVEMKTKGGRGKKSANSDGCDMNARAGCRAKKSKKKNAKGHGGKNRSVGGVRRGLFREGSQGTAGSALPMWGVKQKRSMAVRRTNATFTCHHLNEDEGPSLTRTTHKQSHSNEFLYPTGTNQSQFQVMSDRDPTGKSALGDGEESGGSHSVRYSTRRKKPLLSTLIEESEEETEKDKVEKTELRKPSIAFAGDKAISKSGYTCRGRVKQKAQKRVELVRVGQRKVMKGWFNAGYIFPLGFRSRTRFKSSVKLDAMCMHDCEIVKGEFWPLPTFVITAHDRPDDKLVSKSCTGCWSMVLTRINNEILSRRRRGEKLPPPPKTAIAGPEYFGLIQGNILRKIEALDPDKKCDLYWKGKQDRQAVTENLPQLHERRSNGRSKRRKQQEYCSDEDEEEDDVTGDGEDCDSGSYTLSKWSVLGRSDRYKRRCMDKGSCPALTESDDNPLPNAIDLLTMQPVVTPAISPYGHVLGIATWRAWLSENRVCPFTRNPLSVEQCTILTKNNIEKYRDKIKQ